MSHADHLHLIDHPPEMADDLAAIAACLDEWGIQLVDNWDERSLFTPSLPALGQCDALVYCSKIDPTRTDKFTFDLKTGSIKPLDHSIQLAAYANSTHEARLVDGAVVLEPLPFQIRTDIGLILHAPWGKGEARIVALDLHEGYRLAKLAVAAHKETLNSGRVVVKDLAAAPNKPAEIEAPTEEPPVPPVRLSQRIGDLRQRAKHLTEQGVITIDDARTFMAEQDLPPLSDPDLHSTHTVGTWEWWIVTHELFLDAGQRLPSILERLKALPADLYAHAEMASKALTPPVPHLTTGNPTGPDLDRLEAVLADVEQLHAERITQLQQHLDQLPAGEDLAVVAWATEQRDEPSTTVLDLDNLEAARVLALCESYRHPDLAAALKPIGAREAVAIARPLAELHQIPVPTKGADIAADRLLAGLVLTAIQHNA